MFHGIFSRKLLWCHKKQRTTLHMFGPCRSNSSCSTNQWPWFRSSYQRCSLEKGVLKTFPKFIVKHLFQCLFFIKVVVLSLQLYWKRDSDIGVFLWIFAQFLRAPFLRNTAGRLLLLIPQSQWVYIAMGCFFMDICWVLRCPWYFHNVYYLLGYMQVSHFGEQPCYYEETRANNQI